MALSEYQRGICQLIAGNRRANGARYGAGGVALHTLLKTPRLSRDSALLRDTAAALITSWVADRQLPQAAGYSVAVLSRLGMAPRRAEAEHCRWLIT